MHLYIFYFFLDFFVFILYLCEVKLVKICLNMKKFYILIIALAFVFAVKAQWVDDPRNNTFVANCENSAGELRVVTSDYDNGGVFVQWTSMSANGWSQKLQYLDYYGNPQWGEDGVHITTPNLATWSPGYALAALSDGSVVTMNRNADAHHYVVKINTDGTTPWGTEGMMLFDGAGGGRSELLAGDDGGFWALGTDMDISYLQYVNADGTLRPMATISDPDRKCTNGKLVPTASGVFVVYAKQTVQGYTNYIKEIYVAKYNKNGELLIPETLLFSQQTVGMSYIHYAISDGWRGGYVYQWHKGIGGAYNIYVTHFDQNGQPTISNSNGVAVHAPDPSHYYTSAYATIDYAQRLILAYRQTDAESQTQDRVYLNCITETGDVLWGDGIVAADYTGIRYSDISVDCFKYNTGFCLIYGTSTNTIEAIGYDEYASEIWRTTMSTSSYNKTIAENTTGYHGCQNVVVWVNSQNGGLYGQNIGEQGEMGDINQPSPPPVPCCFAPDYFQGSCQFNEETGSYGAMLTWEPGFGVVHYNLYRQNLADETTEVIEVDADLTSYFDEPSPGTYKYQLTAQFTDSESEFAMTPDGEDHIIIEILDPESVLEIEFEEIVDIVAIYNINGQILNHRNTENLSNGMYIVQGSTVNGKIITKKIVVNN